jgi:hypothetical protein
LAQTGAWLSAILIGVADTRAQQPSGDDEAGEYAEPQ